MRAFNQLVFDAVIQGTTVTYTDPSFNTLIGSADTLAIEAIVDQVSGTSPTLTVDLQHSGDNRNFVSKLTGASAVIPALTLSTSAITTTLGTEPSSPNVLLGYVRLALTLGGTTPSAHIRIYVTGRTYLACWVTEGSP